MGSVQPLWDSRGGVFNARDGSLRDIVALQENRLLLFDESTQKAGVFLPNPLGMVRNRPAQNSPEG